MDNMLLMSYSYLKKIFISVFLILFILSGCEGKKEESKIEHENKIKDRKYQNEEVIIRTSDDLNLSAKYYYIEDNKDVKQPFVILIHQFKSNKEQWSDILIDSLVSNGIKVLTVDLRSHGKSDKANVNIDKLLTDPKQTPRDIEAVVKWAKSNTGIDSNRIGIAGTSIGGSLAFYGSFYLNIKAIVGISVGKLTFENLTGNFESMMGKLTPRVKGVLLICGTRDGEYYKDSKMIFDNYVDDPKEFKEFESDKHGKDLVTDYPGINDLIIRWFKVNL